MSIHQLVADAERGAKKAATFRNQLSAVRPEKSGTAEIFRPAIEGLNRARLLAFDQLHSLSCQIDRVSGSFVHGCLFRSPQTVYTKNDLMGSHRMDNRGAYSPKLNNNQCVAAS